MVVSRTDTARLAKLIALLASSQEVTVGIHSDDGQAREASTSRAGPTVSEVARWQEFGTKHILPRSWLRAWFDEREDEINDQALRAALYALQTGVPLRVGADRLALWAEADIKQRIRKGISPALKAATVTAKGSSTPLIDTGVFLGQIHGRVV